MGRVSRSRKGRRANPVSEPPFVFQSITSFMLHEILEDRRPVSAPPCHFFHVLDGDVSETKPNILVSCAKIFLDTRMVT